MLEEEERSIINVNLKKYPRQILHQVKDLKMELLVKIVTVSRKNCKLFSQKITVLDVSQVLSCEGFLRRIKELYHRFLERWLLLPNRDFTCSKLKTEILKTLEHNVKCF